jgi:hypothetical protein
MIGMIHTKLTNIFLNNTQQGVTHGAALLKSTNSVGYGRVDPNEHQIVVLDGGNLWQRAKMEVASVMAVPGLVATADRDSASKCLMALFVASALEELANPSIHIWVLFDGNTAKSKAAERVRREAASLKNATKAQELVSKGVESGLLKKIGSLLAGGLRFQSNRSVLELAVTLLPTTTRNIIKVVACEELGEPDFSVPCLSRQFSTMGVRAVAASHDSDVGFFGLVEKMILNFDGNNGMEVFPSLLTLATRIDKVATKRKGGIVGMWEKFDRLHGFPFIVLFLLCGSDFGSYSTNLDNQETKARGLGGIVECRDTIRTLLDNDEKLQHWRPIHGVTGLFDFAMRACDVLVKKKYHNVQHQDLLRSQFKEVLQLFMCLPVLTCDMNQQLQITAFRIVPFGVGIGLIVSEADIVQATAAMLDFLPLNYPRQQPVSHFLIGPIANIGEFSICRHLSFESVDDAAWLTQLPFKLKMLIHQSLQNAAGDSIYVVRNFHVLVSWIVKNNHTNTRFCYKNNLFSNR